MAGLNCSCPDEVLTTIVIDDCEVHIGQIQKLLFQKGGNLFDTAAGIPTDPTLKADWDALTAAVDDTKVVVSPLIKADPQIEDGGTVTKGGGDNSTLNGVVLITGNNPSPFTGKFLGLTAAQIKAIRKLDCDTNLTVYLVQDDGKIIGQSTDIATQFTGIPLSAFNLAPKVNLGFGEVDTNEVQFSLPANWDENLKTIIPADFNALVDIDQ